MLIFVQINLASQQPNTIQVPQNYNQSSNVRGLHRAWNWNFSNWNKENTSAKSNLGTNKHINNKRYRHWMPLNVILLSVSVGVLKRVLAIWQLMLALIYFITRIERSTSIWSTSHYTVSHGLWDCALITAFRRNIYRMCIFLYQTNEYSHMMNEKITNIWRTINHKILHSF